MTIREVPTKTPIPIVETSRSCDGERDKASGSEPARNDAAAITAPRLRRVKSPSIVVLDAQPLTGRLLSVFGVGHFQSYDLDKMVSQGGMRRNVSSSYLAVILLKDAESSLTSLCNCQAVALSRRATRSYIPAWPTKHFALLSKTDSPPLNFLHT